MRFDVVAVTGASGQVVERRRFNDFGEVDFRDATGVVVAESPSGLDHGFQGRRLDPESGLMYFRNRYYDPALGRFAQQDPAWDPGNVGNAYTFAGNSSTDRVDPFGLEQEGTTFAWHPLPVGSEFVGVLTVNDKASTIRRYWFKERPDWLASSTMLLPFLLSGGVYWTSSLGDSRTRDCPRWQTVSREGGELRVNTIVEGASWTKTISKNRIRVERQIRLSNGTWIGQTVMDSEFMGTHWLTTYIHYDETGRRKHISVVKETIKWTRPRFGEYEVVNRQTQETIDYEWHIVRCGGEETVHSYRFVRRVYRGGREIYTEEDTEYYR